MKLVEKLVVEKYIQLNRKLEEIEDEVHVVLKSIAKRYYALDPEKYEACGDISYWRVDFDELTIVHSDSYKNIKKRNYFDYSKFFDEDVISNLEKLKIEKENEAKLRREKRKKSKQEKIKTEKKEEERLEAFKKRFNYDSFEMFKQGETK